jgi:hypothetical protein
VSDNLQVPLFEALCNVRLVSSIMYNEPIQLPVSIVVIIVVISEYFTIYFHLILDRKNPETQLYQGFQDFFLERAGRDEVLLRNPSRFADPMLSHSVPVKTLLAKNGSPNRFFTLQPSQCSSPLPSNKKKRNTN